MLTELPKIDYQSHPAYGGMFEPHAGLGERALAELEPLIQEMRDVEAHKVENFGYRYGSNDALSEDLAVRGYSRRQLPSALLERIQRAVQPGIDLIQERVQATRAAGEPIRFKTVAEPTDRERFPELWSAVEDALTETGVLEATGVVFDAPSAKVRSIGALVNHPNQEWATRLYRDLDVPAPPTAGFHIDSDGKCFTKIVLYLSDVGPDQGPFGIVEGSHRWGEGADERIYRRAFDKSDLVVRSAKKRRMFLSLPKEMQVKAEFGGDMTPDSPEARRLLDSELVATGPRGQLNLFNPDAIHRGGNVRSGQRHVLLISVGPRWNPAQP